MESPARPLPTMATLSLGALDEGGDGSSGKRDLSGTSLSPTLLTSPTLDLVGASSACAWMVRERCRGCCFEVAPAGDGWV